MASKAYTEFEAPDGDGVSPDIVSNQNTIVSSGIFSGGSGTLTSFYTSSLQGDQSQSFINVYDKAQTDTTREVQFACGFASYGGSGSLGNTTKTTAGNRETAALYRQFANVLLPPGTDKFTFSQYPSASDDIFFIVMNRARQREKMDPGNWQLRLGKSIAGTDYGMPINLIDDSGATTSPTVNQAGRVFNILSGSIENGVADTFTDADNTEWTAANGGSYGNFYPDLGIIILDGWKTRQSASFSQAAANLSSNGFSNIQREFFKSITSGSYFAARREEEITSTMYFCRVNNQKFNFSNNPTFASSTNGVFTQTTFEGDPKVYITQVGLYNDNDDLLAVAKLSKPILKTFSREAIIKVKLDF